MTQKSWLEIAKRLEFGRQARDYCCASTPSLLISHNKSGYSCYCFKCGETDFHAHEDLTLRRKLQYQQTKELFNDIKVPTDIVFSNQLSDDTVVWLGKAGVSPELAEHYGIGYSKYYNRAYLPIKDTKGNILFQQWRSVDGSQPKYINQRGASKDVLFYSDDAKVLPNHKPKERAVVVVEDILSAIRVGRLQKACAMLGTSISNHNLLNIVELYDTIYIWTDSDKAGIKSRKKLRRLFSLYNKTIIDIYTDKDPKLYNNQEIKNVLRRADDRHNSS